MQATRYQLKYCERCGLLQLQRTGVAGTYCQPCEQAVHAPLPGAALRSQLLLRKRRAARGTLPVPPAAAQVQGRLP